MTAYLIGGPLDGHTCEIDFLGVTIRVPIAEVVDYLSTPDGPVPIFREERYRLAARSNSRLVYVHDGRLR